MAISCWETAQQLYLHLYALITFSNILLGWPIKPTSQVQPCTLHRCSTAGCSHASPSSAPTPIFQPNPFPVPGIPPRSSPLHPWSSSGSIFHRHVWHSRSRTVFSQTTWMPDPDCPWAADHHGISILFCFPPLWSHFHDPILLNPRCPFSHHVLKVTMSDTFKAS